MGPDPCPTVNAAHVRLDPQLEYSIQHASCHTNTTKSTSTCIVDLSLQLMILIILDGPATC